MNSVSSSQRTRLVATAFTNVDSVICVFKNVRSVSLSGKKIQEKCRKIANKNFIFYIWSRLTVYNNSLLLWEDCIGSYKRKMVLKFT